MASLQAVVQQDGASARACALHQGRHFAGVHRVDAGVAVAGEEEDGRIFGSGVDVLVGRILIDIRKILGILGGAVLGGPGAAHLEVLVAQHVEQRIAAPDGSEEVRPLGHGRSHQQAAVRPAPDGEILGRGVLVGDEIFGRAEPIVEDVLLVGEHGGLVPGLAVLVAAAKVGEREPSSLLQPPGVFGVPDGELAERKASVAGHKEALGAVALEAFFARDEHGDAGAVLAGVENLVDLVGRGIEGNALPVEDVGLAGLGAVGVDGGRGDDGVEGVEALLILRAAGDGRPRAEAGELDVPELLALKGVAGHLAFDVVEPEDEELAAD